MKRTLFITMVAVLLLLSELLTLNNAQERSQAATGRLEPTHALQAQSLDFFYKEDARARFLDLKNNWQSAHRGEIPMSTAAEFATEAHAAASVEVPLKQWHAQGGPAPEVISSRLHLFNTTPRAFLNVPLRVSVQAKTGELRVNPAIQMTDYAHLRQTARWQTVLSETVPVAAIAPGEDLQVEVMTFHLLDYLKQHPGQWPSEMQVTVDSPLLGHQTQTLPMIPDHFVIPTMY